MTDLIAWTLIVFLGNVVYYIYERKKLNPLNAADYESADVMIKTRRRNRWFLMGLDIFVLSFWVKKVNVYLSLFMMIISAIIVFRKRPC